MPIDIVVCSKDRAANLAKCVPILSRLPHNNFFIWEGSEKPNIKLLNHLSECYGTQTVLCYGLTFGHIRNKAMTTCTAMYVAIIDDDVQLCPNWLPLLMQEFANPNVIAVSSRIIYDWKFLRKMCLKNLQGTGESGGATIYDREGIISIGNVDKAIHMGEDMELKLRVTASGKKWIRSRRAYALHPITLKQYLERPKGYAIGWKFIMQYSKSKWRFLFKRFASTFAMPIYYFLQTFDLRILGVYFLYKLNSLIAFLRLPK